MKLSGRWRVYEGGEWALLGRDGDRLVVWAFDPAEKTLTKHSTEGGSEASAWREFEEDAGLRGEKFAFAERELDTEDLA